MFFYVSGREQSWLFPAFHPLWLFASFVFSLSFLIPIPPFIYTSVLCSLLALSRLSLLPLVCPVSFKFSKKNSNSPNSHKNPIWLFLILSITDLSLSIFLKTSSYPWYSQQSSGEAQLRCFKFPASTVVLLHSRWDKDSFFCF